jgi:hypothetical protein
VQEFLPRFGRLSKTQAQQVGRELLAIKERHGGRLRPPDVVQAARPKSSPLHSFFDWDDSSAAERWRQAQAARLICSVEIEYVSAKGTTKPMVAFLSVRHKEPDAKGAQRCYLSAPEVMGNADLREQVIQEAAQQLIAWERRHEMLRDYFAATFQAIARDVRKVARKGRRK